MLACGTALAFSGAVNQLQRKVNSQLSSVRLVLDLDNTALKRGMLTSLGSTVQAMQHVVARVSKVRFHKRRGIVKIKDEVRLSPPGSA